jgi:hypothetical protein
MRNSARNYFWEEQISKILEFMHFLAAALRGRGTIGFGPLVVFA